MSRWHHPLRDDAAPYVVDERGDVVRVHNDGSAAGPGRALCSCGALSPMLTSQKSRRRWHVEIHLPETAPPAGCRLCAALSQVSDIERSSLERALASSIGAERIAETLTALGHNVRRWTIAKHRNEDH